MSDENVLGPDWKSYPIGHNLNRVVYHNVNGKLSDHRIWGSRNTWFIGKTTLEEMHGPFPNIHIAQAAFLLLGLN